MLKNKKFYDILVLLILSVLIILGYFIYEIINSEKTISTNITFEGNKSITKNIDYFEPGALVNKDGLILNYDLKGVCILDGLSSALTLTANSGKTYSVSLSDYGKNCIDGKQTAVIPFKDFKINEPLDNILSLGIQFWYPAQYSIQIDKIKIEEPTFTGISSEEIRNSSYAKVVRAPVQQKSSRITPTKTSAKNSTSTSSAKSKTSTISTSTPTNISTTTVQTPVATTTTQTATTSPTQTSTGNFWSIRSVSSMKVTKDKVCNQDSVEQINKWVSRAVELGINYISVETPYDNPPCASSVAYTKQWLDAIRARGLSVWHRHAPLAFEGIYSTPKDSSKNYIEQISNYIKDNPTFFKEGDIFTPIPEPQNGGIRGVTYCHENVCMFTDAAHFNRWLRDAMTSSESAFASIGLGGKIKIGYYGFDGFVAWGDNNPDWEGILEDATITAMGNITIDHYPEIVNDNMNNDLNELQAKYPNIPIIIGEWGTITGGDTVTQVKNSMQAAMRTNVIGFNYWHFGLGGHEALVGDDLSPKIQFDTVKYFFTR